MTNPNGSRDGRGSGQRKTLSAAAMAALWTISNGRCYAPGCMAPVVVEVRPGVYQKNAQAAHIYGVRPGGPRFRADLVDAVRDSFDNLLLLCLPHHTEVDSKEGEDLYPPETLREWKRKHEGAQGSVLKGLRATPEGLINVLVDMAEPPLQRLEAIAEQLETTGKVTAKTVADLKSIISALSEPGIGIDARVASQLSYAAEVFSTHRLERTAEMLSEAAEVLPGAAKQLARAVRSAGQYV